MRRAGQPIMEQRLGEKTMPGHYEKSKKKMDKGGKSSAPISPSKALKILKDGEVKGKPLTKKQKGYFGAKAEGVKKK
jgi:hypothetical protein